MSNPIIELSLDADGDGLDDLDYYAVLVCLIGQHHDVKPDS